MADSLASRILNKLKNNSPQVTPEDGLLYDLNGIEIGSVNNGEVTLEGKKVSKAIILEND